MNIKPLASGSTGNAYLVTDGNDSLLIECGLPFRKLREALDFKMSELDGCLISHCHGDHSKSAKDLMKAGVDVYASKDTIDALGLSGHRIHDVEAMRQPIIGPWTILPFETEHDCPGSLGFLIHKDGQRLLFATDSYFLRYRFKKLNYIMIECNYAADILDRNVSAGVVAPDLRNRIIKSHMSLETVKECLKANDLSNVSEIHLIHLSDANSDEARFKREVQETTGCVVKVA